MNVIAVVKSRGLEQAVKANDQFRPQLGRKTLLTGQGGIPLVPAIAGRRSLVPSAMDFTSLNSDIVSWLPRHDWRTLSSRELAPACKTLSPPASRLGPGNRQLPGAPHPLPPPPNQLLLFQNLLEGPNGLVRANASHGIEEGLHFRRDLASEKSLAWITSRSAGRLAFFPTRAKLIQAMLRIRRSGFFKAFVSREVARGPPIRPAACTASLLHARFTVVVGFLNIGHGGFLTDSPEDVSQIPHQIPPRVIHRTG